MPALLHVVQSDQAPDQAEAAQALAEEFARECGFRVLPWMAREFAAKLKQGFEGELIAEAIQRTARAPRPSWAYLSAILTRCYACGILSYVDFIAHGSRTRRPPDDLPL